MTLQKRPDVSSEIFASFTLSKIDRDILKSMTPEQVEAVRAALLAADEGKRHSVDIRLNLPLYFARYYFVIFAGRDKRKGTLLKEAMRQNKQYTWGGILMVSLLGMLGVILFGLTAFITAYFVKTELGIDLIPGQHAEDIILKWFNK
jgi:hypothetical protein